MTGAAAGRADRGPAVSTRLARDHYLRCDANDYSVHPAVIGRRVELTADLEQVVVTCAGVEVARHRRCWARGQSITDPVHAAAAARLGSAHRAQTRPGATAVDAGVEAQVEHRDLADYDRVFGLAPPADDSVGDEFVDDGEIAAVSA